MRAVVQRVTRASVKVEEQIVGEIEKGLVVLLGVTHEDTPKDAQYLAEKIVALRIFDDADGRMNISVIEMAEAFLVLSHFTLYCYLRRAPPPSSTAPAQPD